MFKHTQPPRTAKLARIAAAAVALFSVAAVAEESASAPVLPHCERPIASVIVGKLACKAANCNSGTAASSGPAGLLALAQQLNAANGGAPNIQNFSGINDGIHDVLVTALTESGCFRVQDREQMDEIQAELARAGKTVKSEQAEFLISGAVTQIDVASKSAGVNVGSVLGYVPGVGGIARMAVSSVNVGTKDNSASVSLDMRLVSVETASVVASKRLTSSTESSTFNVGAGYGTMFGGGLGSFTSLKGTNLEGVTKDAIVQSVAFLVDSARQAKGSN